MQQMHEELAADGYDVHILAINDHTAESEVYQQKLIDECAYPLLQDTEEAGVWGLMNGGKDDFYIYDTKGFLWLHIPFAGVIDTNLSVEASYEVFKQLVKDAVDETGG
jgi:hypothetical protein